LLERVPSPRSRPLGPSGSPTSSPSSAVSSASMTCGLWRRLRIFWAAGLLKIRIVAPSHRNQTGTKCGRPSGRTVLSQMIGSPRRRRSICAPFEPVRSSMRASLLPIAEYAQQIVARLSRDRLFREPPERADRQPYLPEIVPAAGTCVQVLLEARLLLGG